MCLFITKSKIRDLLEHMKRVAAMFYEPEAIDIWDGMDM